MNGQQRDVESPPPIYQCPVCALLFRLPQTFELHLNFHSNNKAAAPLRIHPVKPDSTITTRQPIQYAQGVHGEFFNRSLRSETQPHPCSNIRSNYEMGSTSVPMMLRNPQTNAPNTRGKNPGSSRNMTSSSTNNSELIKRQHPVRRAIQSPQVATNKNVDLTRERVGSRNVVPTAINNSRQLKRVAEQDSTHLNVMLVNKRLKNIMPPPIAAKEDLDLTLKL